MYTFKILLHKEALGGFTVTVPALPGCVTYGEDTDPPRCRTIASCGHLKSSNQNT
jgi:hypothetical protein